MKLFLITPAGEDGPYTSAQINRMHAQGQIKPDQLCRAEGSDDAKPICEILRHLAPSAAVATAAKKQVAAYNQNAGSAGATTGSIMLIIGLLSICFFNPLNVGYGLIIVGSGLIGKGQAQARRGMEANAALNGDQKRAPWEEVIAKSDARQDPDSSNQSLY